jgi:hypothetical protein
MTRGSFFEAKRLVVQSTWGPRVEFFKIITRAGAALEETGPCLPSPSRMVAADRERPRKVMGARPSRPRQARDRNPETTSMKMRPTSARRVAAGALALLLCACTGTIKSVHGSAGGAAIDGAPWASGAGPSGGAASGANRPGTPGAAGTSGANGGNQLPGAPGAQPLRCVTPAVGPSPLRRLTHTEYDNSVADLLGDTTHPASQFAPDTQVGLFDNTAQAQTVPSLLADQYLQAAATLAENVSNVSTLLGCDPAGASGTSCVQNFVQRFGRRAYRRPLTSDEVTALMTIYSDTSAAADPPTGARGVIAAVLASPNFLFRPEFGAAPSMLANAKQVAPFELASRLASLLWASVPDNVLLDAAAAGQLATREQVASQARRMLADPKAHAAVGAFYAQWLGLPLLATATKDAAAYPQFDDALRSAMAEETRRFVDYVLFQDDARLSTLFTAPYSLLNAPLAKLYGVTGPTSATTFQRTMLDPSQRMGVLTQASLMTAFASPASSSPIKRGKLVRVRLLCQDLPDPPANVPPPAPPKAGVSTRERFAMHTNNAACSGCHHLIDGLGFGLEHYDGIGAYRTMDQGVAVDASGEVNTTADIDGPYSGGPALAMLLARSEQVRDCAPTQWLRYALARREGDDDTCSLVALRTAFASSGGDLRELMVALTQTDAFWNYRQPE